MSISMLHFPARFQSVTDQRWTIAPVSTEKLSIATILFQTSSSPRKIVLIMETFPQKGRLTTETHSHFPSLWSTNPRPSFLFRMQIATISLVETNKNQKLCPFEWQHFHVILFVRLHCRDCISKYLRIEKKKKKKLDSFCLCQEVATMICYFTYNFLYYYCWMGIIRTCRQNK